MNIGLFTDTYLPQISGVATSIKTLKDQLELLGHTVYIFTTTDPLMTTEDLEKESNTIVRLPSVPFMAMPERRFAVAGLGAALKIARDYQLDIIHTQTEFGVGILGKLVANQLKIPVIHTLHTKYEDYLHYLAGGRLIKPGAVKYVIRTFLLGTEGVICPSEMTEETVQGYGVKAPTRIIPTGIEIERFKRSDITAEDIAALRKKLDITKDETMLVSLSRLSYEKNIQAVIRAMALVVQHLPARLVIAGHGPYKDTLINLVTELGLEDYVTFVGPIPNDNAALYYKAADFFISASTSETQGLTFSEAIAAGTPVLAAENPYLRRLVNKAEFGRLFASDADIADVILAAIRQEGPMNADDYEKKCYEMSAEAFGKNVVSFYDYMIENYKPLRARAADNFRENSGKMLSAVGNLGTTTTDRIKKDSVRVAAQVRHTPTRIAKIAKKYGRINRNKKKED